MSERKTGFRRISDEAVRKKTGMGWEQWFTELDEFCRTAVRQHSVVAKHLEHYHGLSPWWAQAVVIRYEWERGLRK